MATPDPEDALSDHLHVELQALDDYRSFCAATIQRYYRGWICRHSLKQKSLAQRLQLQLESDTAHTAHRLYTAARTIQDAWRSYSNRRIYRFYRHLVITRESCDPRQMLRCINARECALMDAAAGLHVRFRLGGSSFPPLVFYKIFTHRPVTDIGAFGPRDYAAEAAAASSTASAAVVHSKAEAGGAAAAGCSACTGDKCCNRRHGEFDEFELPGRLREYVKPDGSVGYRSTRGWYRRDDKNGWRPVTERLLLDKEQQAALPAVSAAAAVSRTHGHKRRKPRVRLATDPWSRSCSNNEHQDGSTQQDGPEEQQQQETSTGHYGREAASSSGRSSPVFYHCCPAVRRGERARKLKRRRQQWLLKMYRAGMVGTVTGAAGTTDSEMLDGEPADRCQPPSAAAGMAGRSRSNPRRISSAAAAGSAAAACNFKEEQLLRELEQQLLQSSWQGRDERSAAADDCDIGAAEDAAEPEASGDDVNGWEVEDLVALGLDANILAWTQKLDFDSYQQQWNSLAVTLGSEACLPDSEQVLLHQLQPTLSCS